MKLSFENTETAFDRQSNWELRKAYYLFLLVGNPFMVKFGKVCVQIALALRIPLRWALKGNIFNHFCGGETIDECGSTALELKKYNVGTILDYSVEGKDSSEDFERITEEILRTVETAHQYDHIPFCVFKITGITRYRILRKLNNGESLKPKEEKEYAESRDRMNRIAQRAFETGTPFFLDAEESWHQNVIDELAHELMERYNKERVIVYNTVQMYRHDRLQFLEDAISEAKEKGYHYGVKLVRGAYMEKERDRAEDKGYPSPIQPSKEATDKHFDAALLYCLDNIDHVAVCAGTHNEKSSMLLAEEMEKRGMKRDDQRVFFAQLYGMSDHISFNLSDAGFNVAKYVPYGPIREVIPYLIRRAEENTSVKGQTGRELSLIQKEVRRRKSR